MLAPSLALGLLLTLTPAGPSAAKTNTLPPEAPASPATGLRVAAMVASGTGLLIGSGVVGYWGGSQVPRLRFDQLGRPDTLAWSAGLMLGLFLGALASQLAVPEVTRLGNDAFTVGSVPRARMEGFRLSRWPLLAAFLGSGLVAFGASLEGQEFGRGQAFILVGTATVVTSVLTYGVLELIGVVGGHQVSRRAR